MRGRSVACRLLISLTLSGTLHIDSFADQQPTSPAGFRARTTAEVFSNTLPDVRVDMMPIQLSVVQRATHSSLPATPAIEQISHTPQHTPVEQAALRRPGQSPAVTQRADRPAPPAAFSIQDRLRPADSSDGRLTANWLTAEIVRVQADSSLPERDKRQIIASYENAIAALKSSEEIESSTSEIVADFNRIEAEIDNTAKSLETSTFAFAPVSRTNADDSALRSEVDQLRKQLTAQESTLAETAQELQEAQNRKQVLEEGISQTVEMQAALAEADMSSAQAAIARAIEIENQVSIALLEQKRQQFELRLRKNEKAAELRNLQHQLAARSIPAIEQAIDSREQMIGRETAAPTQEIILSEAGETHPVLQDHVNRNADLARRNAEIIAQTEKIQRRNDSVAGAYQTSLASFKKIETRFHEDGLTRTIGLLLRKDRAHLPDIRPVQKKLESSQVALREAGDEAMLIEDERHHFSAWRDTVRGTIASLESTLPAAEYKEVSAAAEVLIAERRTLLRGVLNSLAAYEDKLGELGANCNHLLTHREKYEKFIDEHVLWVRSHETFGLSDVASLPAAIAAVLKPKEWIDALRSLWTSMFENVAVVGLALFWVLLQGLFAAEIRNRLRYIGSVARESRDVRGLLAIVEATALTLVLSSARPVVLFVCGWLLKSTFVANDLAVTLGTALMAAAPLLAALEFARQLCRRGGLGEEHCGWNQDAMTRLREELRWLIMAGIPITIVVAFFTRFAGSTWESSAGRVAFMAGMFLLYFSLRRLADPRTGPLYALSASAGSGWIFRMRSIWYSLATAIPVVLGLLAFAGFVFAATRLAVSLKYTLTLVLVVTVAHTLLTRCIRLVSEMPSNRMLLPFQATEGDVEQELNITSMHLNKITQAILYLTLMIATWNIWAPVLPVLRAVSDKPLGAWSMPEVRLVEHTDGSIETERHQVPVRFGHLVWGLIIIVTTVIAAKNLPAVIETLILRRLPLDRGARHAVSMITIYLLTLVGIVFGFRQIGIDWSSVQWLIAAMTVGLGFGLQEIFANFVSGLIILFERPIRIGDFVTVGAETGHISRIQFRATTIADLDRREVIVPNKKFITDELINWTLSDPITRLTIPVGVAYGSDTSQVSGILLDVAKDHPLILESPAANAVMTGFGDSSLDFKLLAFIPERDESPQVASDLMTTIHRRFNEAGIEIPFPQQDMNMRSVDVAVANSLAENDPTRLARGNVKSPPKDPRAA